jgi:hypothetical protein
VEVHHRDCGETVTVELRCAADHHVGLDQLDLAVARRAKSIAEAPRDPVTRRRGDRHRC